MRNTKVGKRTPVYYNAVTDETICGRTIQEALGVGIYFDCGEDWQEVKELPPEKRVVIQEGMMMPYNDINRKTAALAAKPGTIEVEVRGHIFTRKIVYVDSVKVILDGKYGSTEETRLAISKMDLN